MVTECLCGSAPITTVSNVCLPTEFNKGFGEVGNATSSWANPS
jgi:hypothetical protein